MRLIIRNKNIYGLWVGIWMVSKILCILWKEWVGHAPAGCGGEGQGSMSLNAAYQKEQQYIWFMGGDLNGFRDITHFMKCRGWGIPPGDPFGIHGPCHLMHLIIRNKNKYGLWLGIWTVSKILSILWNEGGGAYPRGTPWGPKIHVTKCALS